ncbi:hypothetical protein LTR70_007609, partial [Exophiala xenobiotica]
MENFHIERWKPLQANVVHLECRLDKVDGPFLPREWDSAHLIDVFLLSVQNSRLFLVRGIIYHFEIIRASGAHALIPKTADVQERTNHELCDDNLALTHDVSLR